jgi:hypothetical protein
MANSAFVGLRVSPIFYKLLYDYRDYKSAEVGYFRSLASVVQEVMFREMKDNPDFNEYIKNKGVADETNR